MSNIQIREAREGDFEFIAMLMDDALQPYYDGDHRAHAKRIFDTHIAGGTDSVGHFSAAQRMFVMEDGDQPLGMINIVAKRQGTWKISPLIVAPEARGVKGCGSQLLTFAETYARERGARQMYCTVAQQNKSAYQFFRHKGYHLAGASESHYKVGVTEVMLYKPFSDNGDEELIDRRHVSVLPFDEKYAEQVRELILEKLAPCFNGVDDGWVDALHRGYARRGIGEVNAKYKLIFVAVDREDRVLGVTGATPKKGEPIKLMPCVSRDPLAFAAMLIDLPYLMRQYGRKLYIHCVPSVGETMVLQRLGWTIDAVMPAAYHDDFCTQQWGNHLENHLMRNMRVKNVYFNYIMSGRKTLEVRVGYDSLKRVRSGESIKLMTQHREGVVRVKAVRTYPTFEAMLDVEPHDKIVPDTGKSATLRLLQDIYPTHKERLGVLVFELEVVQKG